MSKEIPPLLVLVLWTLLFTGEEPMLSKTKPKVDKKKLKPLLDAGLLGLDKRGRAFHLVPTDRAWHWAEENLDAEFSLKANATPALAGLLPRLKHYMKQTGTPLAELLNTDCENGVEETADVMVPGVLVATPDPANAPDAPPADITIDEAIRMAYLSLTHNQWETRVRLADLRKHLTLYPRDLQDSALVRMQTEGRLVLYRLDDPQDTFEADHAAALYLGSDPRHLVYMKG